MSSYCLLLVHSYKKCLRVGVWKTRLDVTRAGEFLEGRCGNGNWRFGGLELVADYLDHDEWFKREVREGLASLESGKFVSHEEVGRQIDRILGP
jgi:hypothetical protein